MSLHVDEQNNISVQKLFFAAIYLLIVVDNKGNRQLVRLTLSGKGTVNLTASELPS